MFGFSLVPTAERQLSAQRIADLTSLLARAESELLYWRQRADDERERADRQLDTVMQQNGLPEVTPTVRREHAQRAEAAKDEVDKHLVETAEMFSESFDANDDLNWIDPDLREAAAGWMETARAARKDKT
jgi:hypothetical protein